MVSKGFFGAFPIPQAKPALVWNRLWKRTYILKEPGVAARIKIAEGSLLWGQWDCHHVVHRRPVRIELFRPDDFHQPCRRHNLSARQIAGAVNSMCEENCTEGRLLAEIHVVILHPLRRVNRDRAAIICHPASRLDPLRSDGDQSGPGLSEG